jgi:methyl-accepting chemotaxis protein
MLDNLTIKIRLLLYAIFSTVCLILIVALGLRGIQIAEKGSWNIYSGGVESIEQLNDLKNVYVIVVSPEMQKAGAGVVSMEEAVNASKEALSQVPKHLELYMKTDLSDQQKIQVGHLEHQLKEVNRSIEKTLEAMHVGKDEQLQTFLKTELYPTILPLIEKIDDLIQSHIMDTNQDYENALQNSSFFGNVMIIITSLIAIALAIFSYYLIKSITSSISSTVDIINKVSLGDNEVPIENIPQNEMGTIMLALRKMIETTKNIVSSLSKIAKGALPDNVEPRSDKDVLAYSINEVLANLKQMIIEMAKVSKGDLSGGLKERSEADILVHSINDMIVKLRSMITNTQEEILVISNSAEEILASISQVSAGTAETAAAVTETTATVEELKQTAQISSQKAQDVLTSSEETGKIVKTSESALKTTIDEMGHIQEKMNIISDSIIKLSEHGLLIGDIISSVNELAEQSNLLAVNAAIEAAKAGEQGKGFGVVAQEIRTLAEQSKNATARVHAILNDIQNATSTAVMATEQGSKAVNKGVQQSVATNAAIQSLLANILQMTQAAKQISISSQQQLIGVEQVRTAMSNINQASDQHVEHMKQIEEAITSLNDVGKNLKALIHQYKIKNEQTSVL